MVAVFASHRDGRRVLRHAVAGAHAAGEFTHGYQDFVALVHPDDLAMVQEASHAYLDGRTLEYSADFRMRCKDGSWKWILTRGMVVERDLIGSPLHMIGTFTDISIRKEDEALIRHQAFYDGLIGLPNRRMLRDRLEQEIKESKRDQQQLAILFLDLDHFQ